MQNYRAIFDALPYSISVLDDEGRIIAVNAPWVAFSCANDGDEQGFLGASYLAQCEAAAETDEDARRAARGIRTVLEGTRESFEMEYPCHSPTKRRWFLMTVGRFVDEGATRAVVGHMDITQRRLAEEALQRMAYRDDLTGLLNRGAFEERLEHSLVAAQRYERSVAVFFMDLDRFKPVNDRYGHAAGDELIRALADRLVRSVRDTDAPARIGGDEFVLVHDEATEYSIEVLSERLLRAFGEPFSLQGVGRLTCTVSLGVAVYPDDATDPASLIACADEALYAAKEGGRNTLVRYRDLRS